MKLRNYSGKDRFEAKDLQDQPESIEEAIKLFKARSNKVLKEAQASQDRQEQVVKGLKHVRPFATL